jgi:hypothetical protein
VLLDELAHGLVLANFGVLALKDILKGEKYDSFVWWRILVSHYCDSGYAAHAFFVQRAWH